MICVIIFRSFGLLMITKVAILLLCIRALLTYVERAKNVTRDFFLTVREIMIFYKATFDN